MIIATLCLLALNACAQNVAGSSVWEFKSCEASGAPYLCWGKVTHAKDDENISFEIEAEGLKVKLTAASSIGSTGQALRAEVDKILIDKGFEAIPNVVDTVIDAVTP